MVYNVTHSCEKWTLSNRQDFSSICRLFKREPWGQVFCLTGVGTSQFQNIIDSQCWFQYLRSILDTFLLTFLLDSLEKWRITWNRIKNQQLCLLCNFAVCVFWRFIIFILEIGCILPFPTNEINLTWFTRPPRPTLTVFSDQYLSNSCHYLLRIKALFECTVP